jgi:23S rRNA (guanosine2251-2'-O)-methyltransferase
METLRCGLWLPYEVMLSTQLSDALYREIQKYCERSNIPVKQASAAQLEKLCRHEDHQGMIAMMPPFPYTELIQLERIKRPTELCVYLDGIQDPHNLGAIIRSADVLGINAVLIPESGQVGVTNLVVKSSAGAVNAVPIVRLSATVDDLKQMKKSGYKIYGLSAEAKTELRDITFHKKSLIILGNEAEGIRPEISALCDQQVKIQVRGIVDSLNVAVTAGIVMYAAAGG